jgi:hypothetical protein
MAKQDFANIAQGDPSLLSQVESIVVESHRKLLEEQGLEWSLPVTYRWLHYEDPMPVQRLTEAVHKLNQMGRTFAGDAVEKACVEAMKSGFSS